MVQIYEALGVLAYLCIAAGIFRASVHGRSFGFLEMSASLLASLLWFPYVVVFGTVLGIYHGHAVFQAHIACRLRAIFVAVRDRISHITH